MTIQYQCRHCGTHIGTIDERNVNTEELGLSQLKPEEEDEMVQYDTQGNLQVNVICENCHDALDQNPDLHEQDTFIQ
ncbi:anti-sigma-F factor Fin family protein [Texcoconibacillus texcoconensis]|uniref:Anti-sigma-F factor Fin family protein n=1 Tax=Texcoconibacillus texcoconensis TaxID=1095777 RepID=A0A840QU56_9BACI|nr:anti-sigma-F factor Fin family protein [Texcoconibacillus texcoconensis]MBB5174904.1 hypothetical protein [Texcoconibacillus texcoconensis]